MEELPSTNIIDLNDPTLPEDREDMTIGKLVNEDGSRTVGLQRPAPDGDGKEMLIHDPQKQILEWLPVPGTKNNPENTKDLTRSKEEVPTEQQLKERYGGNISITMHNANLEPIQEQDQP